MVYLNIPERVYSIRLFIEIADIMTFSTFGYHGQIWFNQAYTYQCALEHMAVYSRVRSRAILNLLSAFTE